MKGKRQSKKRKLGKFLKILLQSRQTAPKLESSTTTIKISKRFLIRSNMRSSRIVERLLKRKVGMAKTSLQEIGPRVHNTPKINKVMYQIRVMK